MDTPARYGDWLLGGPRSYPEEFIRSTYQLISDERLRQPGGMHWLYNDGTAVDVSDWALPASEWDRWVARSEAGTLRTGVVITPQFAQRSETDRTIPAGHIGSVYGGSRAVHNDWSWAYVEMPTGSPDAAPWTVYLTTCLEEGIPALTTNEQLASQEDLDTGFVPEASDTPVWAWPGPLSDPHANNLGYRARAGWPRWTWANHPNNNLASLQRQQAATRRLRGNSRRPLHPRLHLPSPRHRGLSRLDARPRTQTPRSLVRHRKPLRRIASTAQAANRVSATWLIAPCKEVQSKSLAWTFANSRLVTDVEIGASSQRVQDLAGKLG